MNSKKLNEILAKALSEEIPEPIDEVIIRTLKNFQDVIFEDSEDLLAPYLQKLADKNNVEADLHTIFLNTVITEHGYDLFKNKLLELGVTSDDDVYEFICNHIEDLIESIDSNTLEYRNNDYEEDGSF